MKFINLGDFKILVLKCNGDYVSE